MLVMYGLIQKIYIRLINTLQVREITGNVPKGNNFTRDSFVFIRTGKVGREAGWIVQKNISKNLI